MSRKRNEWLEAESEEELDRESDDDEAFERSKQHIHARTTKRRKIDEGFDSEEPESEDGKDSDKAAVAQFHSSTPYSKKVPQSDNRFPRFPDEDNTDQEAEPSDDGSPNGEGDKNDSTLGSLRSDVAELTGVPSSRTGPSTKSKKKTGVVYISRIPPFMKPATVRSYLSPYGEIGKLFLTPEDHATYTRRKRSGGNKKHSYVDGWVEFLSKKDAKMVADVLNGNIIGGKKGNYYHDDMWNIKYLRGFKWDDLTEQIQRENKEREARLRTEINKAKKENEAFVRDVEKGKMVEGIKSKRKEGIPDPETAPPRGKQLDRPMKFKQNIVRNKSLQDRVEDGQAGRVMSKIL
ncbi:Pre-rRNA-processing protein ESF2 [Sphaceloma murrayae]|uniref:18S rRNA factor 2 n=1 Tax=Sphaceloma murrayae TaxID=2082308 RepID=A0A2K1QTD6_9PEZI|nr:Pre-rRNA-processing protein ESF2 [Sphaceloma murrayae]